MLLSDIVLRSMDRDAIEKEEDSYMDLGGGGPSGGMVRVGEARINCTGSTQDLLEGHGGQNR